MAIDGWTDKFKKSSFFGVSLHYISSENGELVLNDRTLLIRELEDNETKDGEFVKREIDKYLKEFELEPFIENVTFVTDRGTNMVSALRNSNHIHCFAHLINNTVDKILKKLDCVRAATAIVKYFKSSGNNKFGISLKSNVSTRWNSVFYMIDSILTNYAELSRILRTKRLHLDDLAAIPHETLTSLRNFLRKFADASTEIEGSKYPTLHLVNPWYQQLLQHMSSNINDSVFIAGLKKIGHEYWVGTVSLYVTYHHDIATFLHPLMKGLKAHTPARREATHDKITSMLERFGSRNIRRNVNSTAHQASSAMQMFMDNDDDAQESELDEYKNMKVKTMTTLLEWWEDKKPIFPNLYKIARYIHSIPGSSASAERIFSKAGKICSVRPNMRSQLMDEIVFMNSNYDLLKRRKHRDESESSPMSEGYGSD